MKHKLNNELEIEYKNYLKQIGKNIKKRRKALKITQENFDIQPYQVSDSHIRKIESGKINLTLRTLFLVSKKLECDVKDLLS